MVNNRDKVSFRNFAKQKRNSISSSARITLEKDIFHHLKESTLLVNQSNILSYNSIQSEVGIGTINKWILDQNMNLFLPRVSDKDLEFYAVMDLNDCKTCSYHVLEPPKNNTLWNMLPTHCAILIPGVTYDQRGYRSGSGKGYNDQYHEKYNKLITIILAFVE